jgi:uncharacterized membrane protein AbrB (regulator of aidB expression)
MAKRRHTETVMLLLLLLLLGILVAWALEKFGSPLPGLTGLPSAGGASAGLQAISPGAPL